MTIFMTAAIMLMILLSLALLWREGLCRSFRSFVFALLPLAAVFLLRIPLLPKETADYQVFLAPWVDFFRTYGFEGLSMSIGNYNPPYLYFLALFSYLDMPPLYHIKLLSMLFDVLLAWSVLKLVSLYTENRKARFASFFAALVLPTVVLNGAYWGQCDSIYVFFGLIGIYCALSEKPVRAMLCIAASLAFKLQAVFIMPIFFVFLVDGRIKLRHLPIFPAAYVLYLLPPVLLGRDFVETMTLYVSNASTAGDRLNYNSPSLYSIFDSLDTALWSEIGVALAFAFMLLVFVAAVSLKRHGWLSGRVTLYLALLLIVGIPFLLPHMHDRYFFAADVLALALCFLDARTVPCAVCVQCASLLCYRAYLCNAYLLPPAVAGCLMLLAFAGYIGFTVAAVFGEKRSDTKNREN